MKLHENNFPVEISGADNGTSEFKIAFNAKAFRVLSDTLYQDKIGSLVREISTNAYDGHIMAGKQDVPFEVHLPDSFEPWFSVRDFGVGLSKDSVSNIFTTYFMSTKDQSNDTVGAFGLGAKCPFAYTDQFTIESNFDGVKTIYSAFINGAGIPNIAEMHSEETTEGNGVEIKVAVKTEDFSRFRSAVAKQLKYFKVKPIVLNSGYSNFEFERVVQPNEQSIIGDDYIVTPGYSALTVIQGQIGYEIDRQKILNACTYDDDAVKQILNAALNIRLEFPIGHIGVTASRENIEYDKQTVRNIIDKLEDIRKEIQDTVEDKLKTAATGWDKAAVLSSMYSHFKAATNLNYPNMTKSYRGDFHIEVAKFGVEVFQANTSWRGGFTRTPLRYVIPSQNYGFVFVNILKPKTEALEKIQAKLNGGAMYLIFVDKDADISAWKKKVTDYFLGANNFFVYAEHVEKKVRVKNSVSKPKTAFYKINSMGTLGSSYDQELPDEFVYVETSRGSYKDSGSAHFVNEFNSLKALDELKDQMDLPLLGIPVSEMRKIKGSGGVALKDFLDEVKQDAPVDTIAAKVRKAKLYASAYNVYAGCDSQIRPVVVDSGVEYGKMLALAEKAVVKYSGYREKYSPFVADILGIKGGEYFEKPAEKAARLKAKHPILKLDGWKLREFTPSELTALMQVTI